MPWTRRQWTLAALAATAACSETPQSPAPEASETLSADELLDRSYVIDLHCDTPWRNQSDPFDLGDNHPRGQVDIPKMRAGGVSAVFFAVFIYGARGATPEKYQDALSIIDSIKADVASHADDLTLALSADDIEAAKASDKIAILMGIEGGHMIDSDLDNLRHLYELGGRYMTLTHSVHLPWAGSSGDEADEDPGLTEFGREVVTEMNRLGMMVDLSHVSDKTFFGALETSAAPVIASHSSCRALATHPRNVTDDMIRQVADGGGVVHINFYNSFIDDEYRSRSRDYEGGADPETPAEEWDAAMRKLHALGRTPLSVLIDHIEHVANVGGIEHVGLGSDFDGVNEELPEAMEDISKIPNLIPGLRDRGFSDDAISKILGGNTLRVMREVEAHANAREESA